MFSISPKPYSKKDNAPVAFGVQREEEAAIIAEAYCSWRQGCLGCTVPANQEDCQEFLQQGCYTHGLCSWTLILRHSVVVLEVHLPTKLYIHLRMYRWGLMVGYSSGGIMPTAGHDNTSASNNCRTSSNIIIKQ